MADLRISKPKRPQIRVGFLLARHFTLSAFSLFVDTLRLASDVKDKSSRINCDWDVLSSSGQLIQSSSGIAVAPTSGLRDPATLDYIVVVGGLLGVSEPIDATTLSYLKKAADGKVGIVGVCTGSFVLAEAGLMAGKTTCVSWLHSDEFRTRFPENAFTSQHLFVEDGKFITCAGGIAVADLASSLVMRHVGAAAEKNAREILQMERRRSGKEIQSRSPLPLPVRNDPKVRSALLLMEEHIGGRLPIEEIARRGGMSRRQLERLFYNEAGTAPAAAYLKIRMDKALTLVNETERSLIDIALEVGFETSSHFCRKFKETFGISPTKMRNTKSLAAA